jgi:hypothetical protein
MGETIGSKWSKDLAIREIKLRRKTLANIEGQLNLLFDSLKDEILELNIKLTKLEEEN